MGKVESVIVVCIIILIGAVELGSYKNEYTAVLAQTLYVGGVGPGNYSSIQSAIDNAGNGDTVFVYTGTYFENIKISKPINLVGANWLNTIIDGGGSGVVVNVSADWINITGLVITNSGIAIGDAGVVLYNATNCQIYNNNISFNDIGIFFNKAVNNTVTDNDILNNGWNGLNFAYSINNKILNNNILGNWIGIDAYVSSSNIFDNNIIQDSLWGISINNDSIGNTFSNNYISGGFFGLVVEESEANYIKRNEITNTWYALEINSESNNTIISENDVYSNSFEGISISHSSNNIFSNNNVASTSFFGFQITYSSDHNIVTGNNITDNWAGMYCISSTNNTFKFNNISSNDEGFYLSSSADNIIENNVMLSNGEDGIYLKSSTRDLVKNNKLSGNFWGMYTYNLSNSNIESNEFFNNKYGLVLNYSNNLDIKNNLFTNEGIFIRGTEKWQFNSHEIPTNNLVNDKPIYYYKNSNGNDIDNIAVGQLILANCTNCRLENLDIAATDVGIEIAYCQEMTIFNNNIDNNDFGIYLINSSNSVIDFNSVSNNDYGIYITESSDNRIFHNKILNNIRQAYDSLPYNYWNDTYPSGGNFWSDFSTSCEDLYNGENSPQTSGSPDGICDNSYNIKRNGTDYFPLKYQWYPNNDPPSEPIGLSATPGDSYVDLVWDCPNSDGGCPITNYNIFKGTEPGGEEFYIKVGNILSYNDEDVQNGMTYYYKISALNAMGEGPLSSEINCKPIGTPNAPQDFDFSSGDSYVYLYWDKPDFDGGSPITNYVIYRYAESDNNPKVIEVDNILFYNDTNVTNGIRYLYRVCAKNVVGEGIQSNDICAIPLAKPTPPIDLKGIGGDSFVYLFWKTPISNGGSNITNYVIYKSEAAGEVELFRIMDNKSYFNDTKVTNGIKYYYKVTAINIIGESDLTKEINVTPATVPSSPLNLESHAGTSFINISWDDPDSDGGAPILYYNIYRGIAPGEVYLYHEDVAKSYFNDTNVDSSISYYYKVKAVNSLGEGIFSKEIKTIPSYFPINPSIICLINNPQEGENVSGLVEICGITSDPYEIVDYVELKIDDGSWFPANGIVSWTYNWDSTQVDNGAHAIYARACDESGYSHLQCITVNVYNQPQEDDEPESEEFDSGLLLLIALVIIIIVIIVIITFLLLIRKRKSKLNITREMNEDHIAPAQPQNIDEMQVEPGTQDTATDSSPDYYIEWEKQSIQPHQEEQDQNYVEWDKKYY